MPHRGQSKAKALRWGRAGHVREEKCSRKCRWKGSEQGGGRVLGPRFRELSGVRSHKALKAGERRLNCILTAMGRRSGVLSRGVI